MKKIVVILICIPSVLVVLSGEKSQWYSEREKRQNIKTQLYKVPYQDSFKWTVYHDLGYGNDAQQKMDVYLPFKRNSKTETLIIIHGGGWFQGDKSEFNSYVTEFQKRLPGYAFANINYRLANQNGNHFPTQENDIKKAIAFIKNKALDYHISTGFILFGMSAGAHLALLQGYKHSDIVQPRGIISFFGPVDLQQLYRNPDSAMSVFLKTTINATPEGNPVIFAESSPLNFVSSRSAPTLMLHGDKDSIIPIEQAFILRDKLVSAGVPNKLVVYPGKGHGWEGDDLKNSFQQIEEFIKGLPTGRATSNHAKAKFLSKSR